MTNTQYAELRQLINKVMDSQDAEITNRSLMDVQGVEITNGQTDRLTIC